MKYYTCGRIKWLCGIPAYKSSRYRELYEWFSGFLKHFKMIYSDQPFFVRRSEQILGDIVEKIRLPEEVFVENYPIFNVVDINTSPYIVIGNNELEKLRDENWL